MPQRWLVDTNILLRFVWLNDADSASVKIAMSRLFAGGDLLYFTFQNATEYWNASTRTSSENGLELPVARAEQGLRIISERLELLTDTDLVYREWRRLVNEYEVRGKQVHDARLAASMSVHGIPQILTLNLADFARYRGIRAVSPKEFV